ncbi:MAG TPA: alpha/beta fold hydrolase [Longimicrobiales bacterium]|nr:alpha/beta fold hydrolase [Longimicrobiales bacterium]
MNDDSQRALRGRIRLASVVSALMLAPMALANEPAAAQEQLTVERIFGSRDFDVRSVGPIQWIEGGRRFTYVRRDGGLTDLIAEEPGGDMLVLAEGRTLVPEEGADTIAIENYAWSDDGRRLLIFTRSERVWRQNTLGEYWVYDSRSRRLTPVSTAGKQMFAKFSPDGTKVGFVRDNDLYVTNLETGAEVRLTNDGSETVINGTTDWVYEEELDLRDAWRWSPDGTRIAFWRFDQSAIAPFPLIDYMELYGDPMSLRYPKAGTPNSDVRIGVVEVEGGATSWIDPGDGDWEYIARMDWGPAGDRIVFQRMPRRQNRIDVMAADPATGRSRLLFSDTDSAWVDVDDDLTRVNDGRELVWSSERDGRNHLYLYDRNGRLLRQVTRGDWDVTAFHGVDESGRWLYFTGTEQGPLQRHLYRIRLDGSGMERLTREPGMHTIRMSPGAVHYIDVYSTSFDPPVTRLHRADGALVRVLEENAELRRRLGETRMTPPDFFQFNTTDGVTLNGYLIRPPDFDPARRYPVLMYVYGGPGSQTVIDSWGGDRYLWHQLLAQRGYIVASVDNRGTGARGRDFRKIVYLNLGHWETNDQIEAARYLAALPYVDGERIGIWGWSYGGYMTALAMARGGDRFRAGISVAPVTDWRLYDTIYTERFMRTPEENPRGYEESGPLHHAAGLTGDMLLIHGTGDDNVHYQQTVQLVDALIAVGKDFGLMIYPNRTHSIEGGNTRVHLFGLMTDWVEERLGGR